MDKIVLFDKNYKKLINDLTGREVVCFWPDRSKINFLSLFKSVFLKIKMWDVDLKVLYYYLELIKLSPDIVISFHDTNDNILKLSLLFKKTKFILIQDSYRPPGFYGSLKLKEDDILLSYSPLVKFNLCNHEYTFKTFKYFEQESIKKISESLIFISQYRDFSFELFKKTEQNFNKKVPNLSIKNNFDFKKTEIFFLKKIKSYLVNKEFNLYYKSAHNKSARFKKEDETNYFDRFNIDEISISPIDIIKSNTNTIYLAIDSTMIFELLSYGKKVLIYPYRDLYNEVELNLHVKILKERIPELFIKKNFSDFDQKLNRLKNMDDYQFNKLIKIFTELLPFNLKQFLNIKNA